MVLQYLTGITTYLIVEVAWLPYEIDLLCPKHFPNVIFLYLFPPRFIGKSSLYNIITVAWENTVKLISVFTLNFSFLSHFLKNLLS